MIVVIIRSDSMGLSGKCPVLKPASSGARAEILQKTAKKFKKAVILMENAAFQAFLAGAKTILVPAYATKAPAETIFAPALATKAPAEIILAPAEMIFAPALVTKAPA